MKEIPRTVFRLLLLSITSFVISRAEQVEDPCVQDGVPGVITLDENCPYFKTLHVSERFKHFGRGFSGMNALICCKGAGTATVRTTTRKNIYTTADPIVTNGSIESLCESIGPYPGVTISDRIIEGTLAKVGEFPHFASLAYRNEETQEIEILCGGALISHRHILTAAHCFKKKHKLEYVRLGTISRTAVPNDNHVDILVKKITKHPDFLPNSKYHDIAIVELQTEVTFNYFIWPACLTRNATFHAGQILTIAGFGVTDAKNKSSFSNQLMKAEISEVPLEECRHIYDRAYKGVEIKGIEDGIADGLLCAKNTTTSADTCQGDSGSGLKLKFNKNYYIVAVTSFGVDCSSILPSFYTRVSEYIDWIEKVLSS